MSKVSIVVRIIVSLEKMIRNIIYFLKTLENNEKISEDSFITVLKQNPTMEGQIYDTTRYLGLTEEQITNRT